MFVLSKVTTATKQRMSGHAVGHGEQDNQVLHASSESGARAIAPILYVCATR